jgi:hypothetical protein
MAAPAPAGPSSSVDTSLNVLALAKGLLADQLRRPATLFGLLAAVAFVAYRLGRRASGRKLRS